MPGDCSARVEEAGVSEHEKSIKLGMPAILCSRVRDMGMVQHITSMMCSTQACAPIAQADITDAPVAQLDKALPSESRGQRFRSSPELRQLS